MNRCKRKVFSVLAIAILLVVPFAGPLTAQSADEQAIRTAAADWAKAALDKNLDKTVSYYAEDAHMYPFNAPRTETKEDIRKVWTAFLTAPGSVIQTKTTSVTVAKSGDLAYETGTFSLRQNNAQGQSDETPGKYVVVWKKQSNQEWKAVADIFNTDK
jgi:uncharacterized protein (TIGR02246 family)